MNKFTPLIAAIAVFIPLQSLQAEIESAICKDNGRPARFQWKAPLPMGVEKEIVEAGDNQRAMTYGMVIYDHSKDHIVLAKKIENNTTPSLQEERLSCLGSDGRRTRDVSTRTQQNVTYVECDGNCSSISKRDLIDLAYEEARERTFIISGRDSFNLTWGDEQEQIDPFDYAIDDSTFQFRSLLEAKTGNDGVSFHPEVFRFRGQVRHLKDEYPNKTKNTDFALITKVYDVEICPFGDTAAQCAPEEAAQRESRSAPVQIAEDIQAEPEAWSLKVMWPLIPISIIPVGLLVLFLRQCRRPSV